MANFKSNTLMPDSQGGGKRRISSESIYNTLVSQAKTSLRVNLIGSVVLLFICILLAAVFDFDSLKAPWPTVIRTFIISAPFLFAILMVLIYFKHIKKITNVEYSIITDNVQRVVTDDKTVRRHRGRRVYYTTEHAMYLYKCGRAVISLEQTYTISEGDVYYAVVYNDNPTVPLLLYNAKYYEFEEDDKTE